MEKRRYKSNNNHSTPRISQSAPSQHQLLLERWKSNRTVGLAEWDKFVKKGNLGFNHGWGLQGSKIDISSLGYSL